MRQAIVLILFLMTTISTRSQTYKLDASASTFTITGTSTLHDWEIVARSISGDAEIEISEDEMVTVKNLKLIVGVDGLDSGKSAMDKNTVKALNGEEYPVIRFTLSEPAMSMQDEMISATGTLEIAGQKQTIEVKGKTMPFYLEEARFEGKYKMKMTDFGVEPPKALMGTIKTGDDITIHFNVVYKNS